MLLASYLLLNTLIASTETAKISEALGHMIGKSIEQLHVSLDLKALVKGLEDEAAGKKSPLSDEECQAELAALQEQKMREIATQNLAEAISFLAKNRSENGVCQKGELQYKIEKEGSGEVLESYHSPIIRLKAHTLDGTPFTDSNGEMTLDLQDAIPALSQGLLGMKEGEKRTLYVHPSLGYGEKALNALLIFEVELIQLNGHYTPDPLTASTPR